MDEKRNYRLGIESDTSASVRATLQRGFAVLLILLSLGMSSSGCGDDDKLTFDINPDQVKPGERVEISLSEAARNSVVPEGVTYLQQRNRRGRWVSIFALGSGDDSRPPTVTRVTRGPVSSLYSDFYPGELVEEVVRIPRVRPGGYRLAKVLEEEGFSLPPDETSKTLTADLTVSQDPR